MALSLSISPDDGAGAQRPATPTISLVAMPGAGKSTAGRHLASALGLPFVDADVEIERRIGMSIRAFFEREGEAAFRDIEQAVLAELAHRGGLVLATGGGAVLREANRQVLRDHTTVVYLRASPEELFRRLRHDTQRPLLQVADPLRKLRELYQTRDPLYRETAQFTIETGRPSVPTLVNMILMQLELAGVVSAFRPPKISATAPVSPAATQRTPPR
ncbi:shikimate kinase [Sphaerotilus montanus]|uniref:Shikimate kinase n=1 Tax=Sphaerotilus montanus TaxID=522889 RepID=A0A7Y9UIG9_9BURK|nr:shikimate kinase [Sphaerotilus montanus]